MNVNNKVIVVTGAGGGIGQHLVLQLLEKNASVAAVDINPAALHETQLLAEQFGIRLSLHTADISSKDSVANLVKEVLAHHGCVDGIINNAGIVQPFVPLSELSDESIDRLINVNIYGVLNITRAFLPLLLDRPEAHIANVSSMGGLFPFPTQTVYGATKAAIKIISEGLFAELRSTKVGVTAIYPGAIVTNITRNSGAHNQKLEDLHGKFKGTPPPIAAKRIINGIEKNRFSVVIGIDGNILSRLYRLFPKATIVMISAAMKSALSD